MSERNKFMYEVSHFFLIILQNLRTWFVFQIYPYCSVGILIMHNCSEYEKSSILSPIFSVESITLISLIVIWASGTQGQLMCECN